MAIVRFPSTAENLDDNSDDARRSRRPRVLKAGMICYAGRQCSMPCTVRDLSNGGARLKHQQSLTPPDTFELYIELDGLWADCEVAWRKDGEIGVRFLAPPVLTQPKRAQVITVGKPEKPSIRRKPRA